jgi:hypothetical protein
MEKLSLIETFPIITTTLPVVFLFMLYFFFFVSFLLGYLICYSNLYEPQHELKAQIISIVPISLLTYL